MLTRSVSGKLFQSVSGAAMRASHQAVATEESSVASGTCPPATESLPAPSHQKAAAPSPHQFRDDSRLRMGQMGGTIIKTAPHSDIDLTKTEFEYRMETSWLMGAGAFVLEDAALGVHDMTPVVAKVDGVWVEGVICATTVKSCATSGLGRYKSYHAQGLC